MPQSEHDSPMPRRPAVQERGAAEILEAALPGRYEVADPGLFRDRRNGFLLRACVPGRTVQFKLLAHGRLLLGRHRRIVGYEAVLESNQDLVALSSELGSETLMQREAWFHEGDRDERLRRILAVGIQVAEGIAHAHRHSVVHPELRPAAVWIDDHGQVMLDGFGIPENGRPWPADSSREQPSVIRDWRHFVELMREMFNLAGDPVPGPVVNELSMLRQSVGQGAFRKGGGPEDRVFELYRRLVGRRFSSPKLAVREHSADEFARIGSGLLAVGATAEAREHFRAALERDPSNPEALYHRGLMAWRMGSVTDDQPRLELENASQSEDTAHRSSLLLGHLHLERGDAEAAVERLMVACEDESLRPEAELLLKEARSGLCLWGCCLETLGRHEKHATDASFLPDGQRAITTGSDGILRIWDLRTRKCLHQLDDHAKGINCLAVSTDGAIALTGSSDPRITLEVELTPGGGARMSQFIEKDAPPDQLRIWDLNSAECTQILEGPPEEITAVALSADGRLALSGSKDGDVRWWDLASGGPGVTVGRVGKRVQFVGFPPGGKQVIAINAEGRLALFDLGSGAMVLQNRIHKYAPKKCVFSADGKSLLVALYEGWVKVVNSSTGMIEREFDTHFDGLETFAPSPDGQRLLVGGQGTRVILADAFTGRTLRTFMGHGHGIRAAAFHPQGGYALTGGLSGEVKLWSLAGIGERRGALVPTTPISKLQALEAEEEIDLAEREARQAVSARRMDRADAALSRVRRYPGRIRHPGLRELVDALAEGGQKKNIRSLWIHSRRAVPDNILLAVSPNGALAVTSPFGMSRAHLVGLGREEWACEIGEHQNAVNGACFTPDGRRFLTASRDNSILVWDVPGSYDGRRPDHLRSTQALNGHMHWSNLVQVSPDGRRALTAAYHEIIRYWDIERGKEICQLDGPMEFTHALAFGPDGRWAASGHHEGEIRIWDLVGGRCAGVIPAHAGRVEAIHIAADGRTLISVAGDSTLKVWDMAMLRCVLTSTVKAENLETLALTPDGRFALVGSRGGSVRLIDLSSGQVVWTLRFNGRTTPQAHADGRGSLYLAVNKEILTLGLDWKYEFRKEPPAAQDLAPFLRAFLTGCVPPGEDPARSGLHVHWFERLRRSGFGLIDLDEIEDELRRLAESEEPPPPLPAGLRAGEQIPFPVDRLLAVLEELGKIDSPEERGRRLDELMTEFEPISARRFALRARLGTIGLFLRESMTLLEGKELVLSHPEGRFVGIRRGLLEELCRAPFDVPTGSTRDAGSNDSALFAVAPLLAAAEAAADSDWCTLWLTGLDGFGRSAGEVSPSPAPDSAKDQ